MKTCSEAAKATTVHPHACGEHADGSACSSSAVSVHPHACGEHFDNGLVGPWAKRFIPTRVGNMPSNLVIDASPAGSSPRVWGTWFLSGNIASFGRFIPTRVGNMSYSTSVPNYDDGSSPRVWGTCLRNPLFADAESVHPHACGEHPRGRRPR